MSSISSRVSTLQISVLPVDNGVLTLTGRAASYAERTTTERAVPRGEGVRAMAKKIGVRYSNDKQTADEQIAERTFTVSIESRGRARIQASRLQRVQELSATTV
jgi:hypothetical protein